MKAKEYARNCYPYNEEMQFQCECHYERGWDDALKSQWIKVEERMPKENENVFVLYEYDGIILISTDVYMGDNYYMRYADNIWSFGGEEIIAWMPIPSFDEILENNKDVLKRLKYK